MSFVKTGASALAKLAIVVVLAGAFMSGMIGVVYLSLRGEEVKVPEVVGKDFYEIEKGVEELGLKIKKRATRYSEEKPNTVLEQLPRAGETVKTGQTILVILSEANPEGSEAPATIKKENNTNEEEAGTDIAPDKPVTANKNSNVKKPAQSTRDVISNKSNKNTNSSNSNSNGSKSNSNDTTKTADNKNSSTNPASKPTPTTAKPDAAKPNVTKPAASNTPTSGETRTRKIP